MLAISMLNLSCMVFTYILYMQFVFGKYKFKTTHNPFSPDALLSPNSKENADYILHL